MKGIFFSVALLFSSAVFAAVNVEVTTRLDQESKSELFTLDAVGSNHVLEHSCGVKTTVTLEQETSEKATFTVDMVMVSDVQETEISKSEVAVSYGEKASLACTSDKVDAELTLVANRVVQAD